jgi:hypothetical protein
LVYVDNIDVLCGHTVKKATEALVVVSKEGGVEVNAEKTMYMVMSREQQTGLNHNIKRGS